MDRLYSILLKPFDWILPLFGSVHPLWPLVFVSLAAAVLLLLVFARFSDQEALRIARDKLRAHLLEVRLFGHDARLVWRAEKNIVRVNFVYLKLILKPLAITLPIFAWMLFGLYGWFEFRPLARGEAVVVSAFVTRPVGGGMQVPSLETDAGVRVETPVLRIDGENRCDWRVRAVRAGEHRLVLTSGRQRFERTIAVGVERRSHLSRSVSGSGVEAGLPGSDSGPASRIERVEIDYPRAQLLVFGLDVGWVTIFVVLSLAFSFLLKRPLGVTL